MSNTLGERLRRYFSHPEATALLAILLLGAVALKIMEVVLVPVVISLVLTYFLSGGIKLLKQWGWSHLMAVILVFSLFNILLLLLILWLIPALLGELVKLVADIPNLLNYLRTWVEHLHASFPELISVEILQQLISTAGNYLLDLGKYVVSFSFASLINAATLMLNLILIPLLMFFLLRDNHKIMAWLATFLPTERPILTDIWRKSHLKIRGYIQGKLIEFSIVTLVSVLAFGILGLRYAILLGILAGFSVFIPYIGTVISTLPIVVIGITQWGITDKFFYLLLVHTVITILDANILIPLLFAELMNLHPLVIILSVFIFGNWFGFWGIFFAIPLTTIANLILQAWPVEQSRQCLQTNK